jgi:putative ABC transport system ATP-binding protein
MSITEVDANGPARPVAAYRLSDLLKTYPSGDGSIAAVDGIDLEIAMGDFVVIAGPSGSGKSTLLQLLGALDRPTEGEVRFEDRDLAGRGDAELADLRRDRIGFVFQQFNLIPTLSARENVEVAIAPTSRPPRVRDGTALAMLERVGLVGRADHLPSQLSGGEQQRVAIARALANDPDVVLVDEPTGNLDTKAGDAIIELLYRLWQESGLTVVLITHDPAIAGTAPRLIRLVDGRIESEESPRAEGPELERERSGP